MSGSDPTGAEHTTGTSTGTAQGIPAARSAPSAPPRPGGARPGPRSDSGPADLARSDRGPAGVVADASEPAVADQGDDTRLADASTTTAPNGPQPTRRAQGARPKRVSAQLWARLGRLRRSAGGRRRVWVRLLRELSGDADHERYVEWVRRVHGPHAPVMSEREFYRMRDERSEADPRRRGRCC